MNVLILHTLEKGAAFSNFEHWNGLNGYYKEWMIYGYIFSMETLYMDIDSTHTLYMLTPCTHSNLCM